MDYKVPRRGILMNDELNQEEPTRWEMPSEPEAPAVVEVVDTPEEPEPEPEVEPEPEAEPVVEVVSTPEEPAVEEAKSKKSNAAAADHQDGEVVVLSKLVLGGNERMSNDDMLNIANEMEGHPDNVSAAIFGGANLAWQESQRGHVVAQSLNFEVDPRIGALAFVPSTELSTSKARKMLPETIPHSDAVKNSSNVAVLVQALQHRPDLLLGATEDYLHQFYRKDAMPNSFALMTKLRKAGVAAFISGAGPTVLVLHTGGEAEAGELERAAGDKFQMIPLGISRTGVSVVTA
jgi:homoserine kinase